MQKKLVYILFISLVSNYGCRKINSSCMMGETIGEIRSGGGGLAVSLDKKYKESVTWQGEKNVIELMNIPTEFQNPGSVYYFSSRSCKNHEQGLITADGDESIELILYGTQFSPSGCP